MPWQRLDLVVEGEHAEALAGALEEAGALSTELTDADEGTPAEKAVFGEPGADSRLWPRTRVSALFNATFDAKGALGAALAAVGLEDAGDATIGRIEDADWVALTQKQFEPIHVGERLWIVPTWYELPDPGAVNIILDPGAAFGTGSHATTRLCLEWLEATVRGGEAVLDYGCGSGILAIAALKLGAGSATGVDIDPQSLEAARYNSTQNGVRVEVLDAQQPIPRPARITVANILANPLRMLAPVIASSTEPGGRIALSGILEEQADSVIEAYRPWADLAVDRREAGWVLLTGVRERMPGAVPS
jgi:ribosomal protein L11 methyltransferase